MPSSSCLTLRAPAKVNLVLAVLGELPDGYHRVETLLQAVSLCDEVALMPRSDDILLSCDEPGLATDERNLCYRAAALLAEHGGPRRRRRGVAVTLRKHIPMQAGLGGGSSDAAATLLGLNRMWGLGLRRSELVQLARQLGADVPFFIGGGCAVATGRGDEVTRIGPGPSLHLVLARSGAGVSTAWAYARSRPGGGPAACQAMLQALAAGSPQAIAAALHNDLERAVLPVRPDIAVLKRELTEQGALGAVMAGSGSAVLGVFARRREAQETAARMSKRGVWAQAVHSIGSGAACAR